jgi:hypothetical protein
MTALKNSRYNNVHVGNPDRRAAPESEETTELRKSEEIKGRGQGRKISSDGLRKGSCKISLD